MIVHIFIGFLQVVIYNAGNMSLKKKVSLLIDILSSLTPYFVLQNSNVFFDELPVHFYSGLVRFLPGNPLRKKGYELYDKDIVAGGSSVDNKMLGILKCAAELVERLSLFAFHPKNILLGSRETVLKNQGGVDPYEFNERVKNRTYGWVRGNDLIYGKNVYIPAQAVYLNYYSWARKHHKERKYIQHISNGGTFGFTKESALLRAIYELIERDAILTKYLAMLPFDEINMKSIKSQTIKKLNDTVGQYNFTNILAEATGDLGIPTFFAAAIDNSSVVPSVTFGAKSSLHRDEAMLGAMEESHMGRTWVRYELLKRQGEIPKINPNRIHTRLERAFYYADKSNSMHLLKSLHKKDVDTQIFASNSEDFDSDKKELAFVLDLLKKKNIRVVAVDIKPSFLDPYPIYVYKVIMPDLQYLYLEEKGKIINRKRIESVCKFYNRSMPDTLQTIPHFLL